MVRRDDAIAVLGVDRYGAERSLECNEFPDAIYSRTDYEIDWGVIKIIYDLEYNDKYYIYTESDISSVRTIKWFIPKELHNNEIVKSQMRMKLFDELFMNINSIKAYNVQLTSLYLDIEKQSIEKRKQIYREKCYKIMDSINKGLSPYHWEVEETNQDSRGVRTPCYLIGLFTGKNSMREKIEKM